MTRAHARASTNDRYITIERARELATAWGADFVNAGAVGHINVEAGFGPWPESMGMVSSLIAWANTTKSTSTLGLTVGAR
jgi:predicted alpha/beta hydrolase family esterase